jgi:hypothetical protein
MDQRAWREICAEAAAGKIDVEALQVVNPDRGQMLYRRSDYYRPYNQRVIIPRQFFEQDIMIAPGDPVVIYYRASSPFSAPWVDPVVILKPEPAYNTDGPDVAEQPGASTGEQAIGGAVTKRSNPTANEKRANARQIALTFIGNDGKAPNARDHTSRVMGKLTAGPVGYRMKRNDVEALIETEFASLRRPVGRPR